MTFSNPVIPGFHPDPSVCRVDDAYVLVTLGYEDEAGTPRTLAQLDGRYLSTEVTGGFSTEVTGGFSTEVTGGFFGRTIGMFAVDGDAAFDWFDYQEA